MSSSLQIDPQSLRKLKLALKELPDRGAKRAMKSAIRAGGSEIIKESRKELKKSRFNYSTLSASLGQKVLPLRKYGISSIIGPRTRFTRKRKGDVQTIDGWYAHIVEYGTLGSRSAPLSARTKRKVDHNPMPKGLRPSPFLRPGYDKAKGRALDKVGKKLWEAIKREAMKLK
jgi:hypothetical protein